MYVCMYVCAYAVCLPWPFPCIIMGTTVVMWSRKIMDDLNSIYGVDMKASYLVKILASFILRSAAI